MMRLCILLAVLVFSVSAAAQQDDWRPGDPTIAYEDFPFPEVTDGEIWVPELLYRTETTIVPDSIPSDKDRLKGLQDATNPAWLDKQGRKDEALALRLRYLADPSFSGSHDKITSDLVNYYLANHTADPAYVARADALLVDLAEQYPWYFKYLGLWNAKGTHGRSINMKQALHYYSKGLSRGCRVCGDELVRIGKLEGFKHGISKDTVERWRLFSADMGSREDYELLDLMTGELGSKYRGIARREFGTDWGAAGGLTVVIQRSMRSGLVPKQIVKSHEALLQHGGSSKALDWLIGSRGSGRYTGFMLSKILTTDLTPSGSAIGSSFRTAAELRAVKNGQLQFAMLGARAYANEKYVRNRTLKGTFLSRQLKPRLKLVDRYLTVAERTGFYDASIVDSLRAQTSAAEAYACWTEKKIGDPSGKLVRGVTQYSANAAQRWAAKRAECVETDAIAIALNGRGGLKQLPGSVLRLKQQAAAATRASDAQIAKALERNRQRAILRGQQTFQPGSYIATSASSAPIDVISSAGAAESAKRAYCAGSEAGTRYCR